MMMVWRGFGVQVSYTCSQCHNGVRTALDESTRELPCPHCGAVLVVPPGAVASDDVRRCVACPSEELFVRKDFPQRLGVTIVVVGIVLSTIAWYYRQVYLTFGIFFATALIDFVLWMVMGNVLQCYRCQAQYRGLRGLAELERHGGFDLETHEKHRQQLTRLAEAQAGKSA
jgi:DNA-directed RNA polymerase subunit RPC12/RpoP